MMIISEQQIQNRIAELGDEITSYYNDLEYYHYYGRPLLIIGVLNGCLMFLSDLVRNLKLKVEIDFIKTRTYCGKIAGKTDIIYKPSAQIFDRFVLLVDDILDTGQTLNEIYLNYLHRCLPMNIQIVTLLRKPSQKFKMDVRWTGFCIDNEFVYGYGLDRNCFDRNLRDIYIMEE